LEKERPRYLVIYDDGFNYLTKICLTRMREAAFEMTTAIAAVFELSGKKIRPLVAGFRC